jgi:NitT/TauT family transport system substrate-binding protein
MPSTRVRILMMRHATFYTPVIAAIAGGFLEREGLEAEYLVKEPDQDALALFENGEIEIAQSAVSSSWARIERGLRNLPVHFAQVNQRDGFWVTARGTGGISMTAVTSTHDSGPFDWTRLEGRTILADHGPQPLTMLKYAAQQQGVDWNRVKVVDAGDVGSMDAAFRDGQGDFIHQQGPSPQQLLRDGVGHIVASVGEAMPAVAFSSLSAMPVFLETETAAAFMRGYRKALSWAAGGPAGKIAAMLAPYFKGMNLGVLSSSVASYKGLGCWNKDPVISKELYEQALEVFASTGGLTQRPLYEDVVARPPE